PFIKQPTVNSPVTWVKPKLIAEVSFTEWTKGNRMRHPIFQGLRMDKPAKSVKKEIAKSSPEKDKERSAKKYKDLSLTHLDKIYWPKEKYTKGDLLSYYEKIAPYILPYLKDHPIILHRLPDGIQGKDFYQKDMSFPHPDWIHTYAIQHEEKIDN